MELSVEGEVVQVVSVPCRCICGRCKLASWSCSRNKFNCGLYMIFFPYICTYICMYIFMSPETEAATEAADSMLRAGRLEFMLCLGNM